MGVPGVSLLVCFVLLTTVEYRTAAAQETADSVPPTVRNQPSEDPDEPHDAGAAGTHAAEHTAETADEHREKERMANVALVLLVGIASAGILLIAGVLIWGSRVRRISRHRDPAAPLDPLWYLRGSPPLETGNRTPKEEQAAEPAADSPDSSAGPDPDDPAEPPKPG